MIKINKASSKDLLGVAKLILNNFVKEINKNIPELESEKDANQKKFLLFYLGMYKKRTPHCVFVAKDGDEIVGASGGHVNIHHWGNSVWGIEDYWFIKKKYRNGKEGKILYEKLQSWFKKVGVERISMTHYSWSPYIGEFYKKDGYVPYDINYVKVLKEES